MSFWDTQPNSEPTAPAQPSTQNGGFWGSVNAPAPAPTPQPTAPIKTPYFAATTPKGESIGFSDEKDVSGKPYFAFRNPGDTSTTTDKTRVATTFDPRVAQKLDPQTFDNYRMSPSSSASIKKEMGGDYSEELDHKISLELSGSNDTSNLQLEPMVKGTKNTATDPLENRLAQEVAQGKKSLWQAQTDLATAKKISSPWTGDPDALRQRIIEDAQNKAKPEQSTPNNVPQLNTPTNIEGSTLKTYTPPMTTIKMPFMDKSIDISAEDPIMGTAKFFVELPERAVRTIGQAVQLFRTGTFTPTEANGKKVNVETPFDAQLKMHDALVKEGASETQATWIAALYAGSSAVLDIATLGSILSSGAHAIETKAPVSDEQQVAATQLLGNPKTTEEAEASYRNLIKSLHPDNPETGNAEAASQLNNAIKIIREKGPAETSVTSRVADVARRANGPLSDLFGKYEQPNGPTLPLKQLPGYRDLPPNPEAGGINIKPRQEPVGFGDNNLGPLENDREESVLQVTNTKTGESFAQAIRPGELAAFKALIDTPETEMAQEYGNKTNVSYHLTSAMTPTKMEAGNVKPVSGYADYGAIKNEFETTLGKNKPVPVRGGEKGQYIGSIPQPTGLTPTESAQKIFPDLKFGNMAPLEEKTFDKNILPPELKPYANYVTESDGFNDGILANVPLKLFGKPKFETLNQSKYKPGEKITEPIQAVYDVSTKKYRITDGANRFTQALANGDKSIPVVVELTKAGQPISGRPTASVAAKTYKPFTSGPKAPLRNVEALIRDMARKEGVHNLSVTFDRNLLKNANALGQAKTFNDVLTGETKNMIRLLDKGGKASVRTAFHELKHLVDRLDEGRWNAWRKEAAAKMDAKDFAYYKAQGYKTRGEQIDEFMADEWGKKMADEAGYKSRIDKVLDAIKAFIEKIKTTAQKVFQAIKETPNKQGGFIKNPLAEEEPMEPLVNQEHVDKLHDLENQEQALAIKKEAIDQNPAKPFLKNISRKTGTLPESIQRGDEKAMDAGFKDYESLREATLKLQEQVKEYKADIEDFKQAKRELALSFKTDQVSLGKGRPPGDYDEEITQANGGVVPPVVRGGIQAPEVRFDKWKDINPMRLTRDTMERNLEKVAPAADAKKVNDFLIEHVRKNEEGRITFVNKEIEEVQAKLKELFGGKVSKKDSKLIRLVGEKIVNASDVPNYSKNSEAINKAADFFRKKYDLYLDKWNEHRRTFDYSPVPKRADYFHHTDDITFYTDHFGFLNRVNDLPTTIAGETEFYKPGKPFSRAELRRLGKSTKIGAVEGMQRYLMSVSRQMYHIDSLQRGRAIEKYLKQAAQALEDQGKPLHLTNFKSNLYTYINTQLGGKMTRLARAIEEHLGMRAMNIISGINRIVGNNIIVGNASAALSHLVSLPLNFATVSKVNFVRGIADTLTAPFLAENYHTIDGVPSGFMIRRYPKTYIQKTLPQTVEGMMNTLIDLSDRVKVRMAVSSKYYDNLSKGMSKEEAMKDADNYAGRIVGDYSIGGKPNIMNEKAIQILARFQLGMNDGLSVLLHDIPKQSTSKMNAIWRYTMFAVGAYIIDQELKRIRGAGRGLDPIDWALTMLGLNDEGKSAGSFMARLSAVGSDMSGELPFTSMVTGNFPMASAFQDIQNTISGKGDIRDKIGKIVAEFGSPIGGGAQVRKTIQGISAVKRGYATDSQGNPTQKIEQTPLNYAKGAIFGQSALTPKTSPAQASVRDFMSQFIPLYDAGKTDEAQNLVNEQNFNDAQYADFKKALAAHKASITKELDKKMLPLATKVFQASKSDPSGETGQKLIDAANLTDKEYEAFKRMYKKVSSL